MDYALTCPDAVFLWTREEYSVNRPEAYYPIHLKVRKDELKDWIRIFKLKDKKSHIRGKPVKRTLLGIFYILYPEEHLKFVEIMEGNLSFNTEFG